MSIVHITYYNITIVVPQPHRRTHPGTAVPPPINKETAVEMPLPHRTQLLHPQSLASRTRHGVATSHFRNGGNYKACGCCLLNGRVTRYVYAVCYEKKIFFSLSHYHHLSCTYYFKYSLDSYQQRLYASLTPHRRSERKPIQIID